jgi:hypothetical protein
MRNLFRYFNSSPEIIRLTVMMYVRYGRRSAVFCRTQMKRLGTTSTECEGRASTANQFRPFTPEETQKLLAAT